MVRNYRRKKTDEGKYTKEDLREAVREVSQGRMTYYRAVLVYNVPYSTLYCQVNGTRGKVKKYKGRATALSNEDEAKLVTGLAALEKWGFGLTRKELLELVGKYVNQNKIKTPFKNGVPGPDWFISFKRRHNLSIKVPQNVEYARKKATDPFLIYQYFDKLKEILDHLDLHNKPDQVWNLDETSLSIDPSKTKVVGLKGKVCTRTISTPGRENTTVLLLASASGIKAPPLIIFKGANVWDQWVAPNGTGFPGTVYAASKRGWMEANIFRNYFIKTLIPFLGDKRPQLIIYDGHATHVDVDIICKAIEENITILKLPPHSSHLLQPLDLSVFKALKVKWDAKLITWQRQHVGQKLPKKLFSQFLGETWRVIEAEVIQNGFKKGGIIPCNRDVIPVEKFCPEALKRWNDLQKSQPHNKINENQHERNIDESLNIPSSLPIASVIEQEPECSTITNNTNLTEPAIPSTSSRSSYSFEEMLLSTVRQKNLPEKMTKRKVISGAEVITSEEVLQRLQDRKASKIKVTQKKKYQPKPETSSEDESYDSPTYQESDNEEEFWQNIQDESIANEPTDAEMIVDIGKWVIVQYPTKKNIKHFVGKILEKTEDDEWVVKFARKKKNIFYWPPSDDIDTIKEQDIVRVLPNPNLDRRGSGMIFNLNFDGFLLS